MASTIDPNIDLKSLRDMYSSVQNGYDEPYKEALRARIKQLEVDESLAPAEITAQRIIQPRDVKGRPINKNDIPDSGALMFPLKIEYNVPHVYIKIFDSETGPITRSDEDRAAGALVSGGETLAALGDEYSTEIAALYGAWVGTKSTTDLASFIAIRNPGLAAKLVGAGATTGAVVGVAAAETAKLGIDKFFETNLGKQAKASLQNLSFRRNIVQLARSIFLAMPEGIDVSYNQDYDAISVTNATGAAGGVLQALADYKATNKNMEAMTPYALEAASKFAESKVGGEGLAKLTFFGATGLAVNPQMEMIYSAPQLRTFRFDFRLVPRNSDEAKAISKIITELKTKSSPRIDEKSSASGRYFIPPSQFEIEFYDINNNMYQGSDGTLPYLYKTKKCVLKGISVDYTGGGAFATFHDGAPVETRLQLEFQETTILTAADMAEGY